MIRDLFTSDKQPLPNKFTTGMGDLIRNAREEAGLSQADLAKRVYRRQASISDIENGKMEVNVTTLMVLAIHLKKPISYFFPKPWHPDIPPEKLSSDDQELLLQGRRLNHDDMQRLIAQARALADVAEREDIESMKFEEDDLNIKE